MKISVLRHGAYVLAGIALSAFFWLPLYISKSDRLEHEKIKYQAACAEYGTQIDGLQCLLRNRQEDIERSTALANRIIVEQAKFNRKLQEDLRQRDESDRQAWYEAGKEDAKFEILRERMKSAFTGLDNNQ